MNIFEPELTLWKDTYLIFSRDWDRAKFSIDLFEVQERLVTRRFSEVESEDQK